jgi:Sec-independent protein secretion pathway component TatC
MFSYCTGCYPAIDGIGRHVLELKRRLRYVGATFLIAVMAVFVVSIDIVQWIQRPNALTAYEVIYTQLTIAALLGEALFQVPSVAVVLSRAGLMDATMMREHRSYFYVGMLVVAAVSTPLSVAGKGF